MNSCVCHDGFMGNDCSQIAPTFAPPMYPRTPYPGAQGAPTTVEPENTSPNVHIRKSVLQISFLELESRPSQLILKGE